MVFGNHAKNSQRSGGSPVLVRTAFLVAALTALLVGSGCGGGGQDEQAPGKEVRCELGVSGRQTVPQYVTATGNLVAEQTVMVSTRMMGWVNKIHVVEGQRVSKGTLLLSIDDTDLQAKKAQAEAGIAEARAVLANAQQMAERFIKLYEDKSVSKQQLDDVLTGRDRAAAGVEMAKAGLREVNVHLGYLDIVAPVDGVVARKMIEAGNMANPGMPLLMLEQNDRMKVIAHLGEKDVTAVKAGDLVRFEITSLPGAVYEVPLARVITTANPGSRTFDIEAYLDNPDGRLKSGMFARARVPIGEIEAVLVPDAAIIRRGQLTGVWVVGEENQVDLRWIRLGHPRDGAHEVLAGLTGGETLVLSSDLPLAEGCRVVK